METKKLLHGIIALAIFIALAIGANNSSGLPAIFIILAMALHAGDVVNRFGRNWPQK